MLGIPFRDHHSDPGRDLNIVATPLNAVRQVAPGEYTDVPSTELYSFRSGAARLSASAPSQPTDSSPSGPASAQAPGSEPDGTVVDAAAFAATASVSEPSADGMQAHIASQIMRLLLASALLSYHTTPVLQFRRSV